MRPRPRLSNAQSAWRTSILAALACGGYCHAALAHGLGKRFDLPLPLEFWVTGAGATILLSFVLMGLFVRAVPRDVDYPRRALFAARAARRTGGVSVLGVTRLVVVAIFLLTIVAGLYGTPDPFRNFAPTMIWVLGWIGLVFVSALFGDVWAVVNPLRTLFVWTERGYERLTGQPLALNRPYPARLGVWPAVVAFIAFAWAQLIWLNRDVPAHLALLVLAYALWTWLGMARYGRAAWLRHGEVFAVAFGILARLAPVEIRVIERSHTRDEVRWNLRPPAVGLLDAPVTHLSGVVFVLAMLATVTFDGLLETASWQEATSRWVLAPALAPVFAALGRLGIGDSQVVSTVGLILMPGLFLLLYLPCAWATAQVTGRRDATVVLACRFVLTLVPIALAYDLAHNLSTFVTSGQFIVPLASDPLGRGWDLLGTAGYKPNLLLIDAAAVWYFAVSAIVLGHVAAVYLAHTAALHAFGTRRAALLSQVPMVVLMMIYTMSSLWILAQPIVG